MSVGILQTNHKYHRVSKQVAVQILLEKGYEALLTEFESMDEETQAITPQIVAVEEPKPTQRSFDMKVYAEMANKAVYEPRKVNHTTNNIEYDSRVQRLQQKLGLR